MAHQYSVLVVWEDGKEEYLKQGAGSRIAKFNNRREAEQQRDFMKIGMEDECESISVVTAPAEDEE